MLRPVQQGLTEEKFLHEKEIDVTIALYCYCPEKVAAVDFADFEILFSISLHMPNS